jgi:hypothetical protein
MAELTRRYVVMAMASEAPFDPADPEGVFVLKPWKDPAALRALETYRENCYPELARDLAEWIAAIAGGPIVRGEVGRRNEPHLRVAPVPAAPPRPRKTSPTKPARAKAARTRAGRRRRRAAGKKRRSRG